MAANNKQNADGSHSSVTITALYRMGQKGKSEPLLFRSYGVSDTKYARKH